MSFLLDTNVISEARKRDPSTASMAWFEQVDGTRLFLSVLVIGEIRQGMERLKSRDPARAEQIEKWLETLKRDYRERVLPVTDEVAEEWGRLNAAGSLPVIDGLLAATASVHDLTLVTRNVVDFQGTGVRVLDPFAFV